MDTEKLMLQNVSNREEGFPDKTAVLERFNTSRRIAHDIVPQKRKGNLRSNHILRRNSERTMSTYKKRICNVKNHNNRVRKTCMVDAKSP